MALAREELERAARLAALSLDDEEVERLRHDLSSLVGYFEKLLALDVSQVPPTDHATMGSAPTRPDVVRPSLPVEKALANAPESDGFSLLVPRIIE